MSVSTAVFPSLGIVHVFIAANASKQRLTELTGHAVPSILASTVVLENSPGNLCQTKSIVKFAISQ
jgi:hypothetical protein